MDCMFIFLSSHSSGWEAFLTGGLTALIFTGIFAIVRVIGDAIRGNKKDWEEIKKED